MTDQLERFTRLRRPRLLVRAARFGLPEYSRNRDLKRILKVSRAPNPMAAVDQLLDQEARLEEARLTKDATYNVTRHVDVLICLMAEVQVLNPAPSAPITPPWTPAPLGAVFPRTTLRLRSDSAAPPPTRARAKPP